MELQSAHELALTLMHTHGLCVDDAWTFAFDRAHRRAGQCNFTKRQITISAHLTRLYNEEQVRHVLLHEIAHALVGPDHGHDSSWRHTCIAIGGDGRARLPLGTPEPEAPWVGRCPRGHEARRFRRPTQLLTCRQCSTTFAPQFALTWENISTGETVAPLQLPLHSRRPRRTRATNAVQSSRPSRSEQEARTVRTTHTDRPNYQGAK